MLPLIFDGQAEAVVVFFPWYAGYLGLQTSACEATAPSVLKAAIVEMFSLHHMSAYSAVALFDYCFCNDECKAIFVAR
jgi:hypothetical protein